VMLLLASFVLLKKQPNVEAAMLTNENAARGFTKKLYQKSQNALPPQQSIPASAYATPAVNKDWRDTKDLVQPSVTEGTTKLLERDE